MAAIIEKIKGVFTYGNSNNDDPKDMDVNTPDEQKMFDVVWQDYQIFKTKRQDIQDVWRKEQRFYRGDHWFGLRPDEVSKLRPNSVDNIAWSQIESIVSRLTGWVPAPDFEAQEPGDEQKAQDLNDFIPYDLRQINFKSKHARAVRRFVIHGPLIYKMVFDPTVEGGRGLNRYIGQNDIIPVELGSFFPDPRIKDFIYLQSGAAHIIHTQRTLEYFIQRWPKKGKLVNMSNFASDVEIFFEDQTEATSGVNTISQTMRSGLMEYWYRGKPKTMTPQDKKMFKELGDEQLQKGVDPSENFAKAKGTMNGVHCIYASTDGVMLEHKSYVYDHGKYPFVARVLFPDEDTPWGKGYMRDMISPQIMLNKFSELAVETMAKAGGSAIVYDETAITKTQTWKTNRSLPHAMLPVAAGRINDGFKELQGVNVPQTVFEMIGHYKELLQKLPGMFDSANGQANSQVNSGVQAQALINASSGRLSYPSETIQDALEEVFAQYIDLMAQFYTTERIGRITGRQVSMSRDSLVSQAESTYKTDEVDKDTGEVKEIPVIEEYVPCFDIKVNIGVEKPKDREYYINTALNLVNIIDPMTQMPMIDGKAVQYTLENGRMEPFSVIDERMQKEQQQVQQVQQSQQQVQQLQQQLQQQSQQDHQVIQQLQQQLQQLGAQLQQVQQSNQSDAIKAQNEQNKMILQAQQQDHNQQMQMHQQAHSQGVDNAKLGLEAAKITQMEQRSF